MERFGKAKKLWLGSFLQLPHGIPSHDTFNRVFQTLAPQELEKSFLGWVSSVAQRSQGEVVAIDAMGCQRVIAGQIVEQKANYLLAVKENQPSLLADIKDSFQMLAADAVDEQIDCGHGRVETRRCSVVADLSLLDQASAWPSLQAIVRVEATRFHKATGKQEQETRYYITSLGADAERLNQAIRQHWGIENKLHWVLDVAFGEDLCRKRAGNAAQNFSLLNRFALNLLRQDKSSRLGVHGKRLAAAWDHDYLLNLLAAAN
jgi:predicted transposase YbfD/YdcC